jgi:lysophospholipase L1-like esterase
VGLTETLKNYSVTPEELADADHPDDAGYTLMGTMLGAALAARIA